MSEKKPIDIGGNRRRTAHDLDRYNRDDSPCCPVLVGGNKIVGLDGVCSVGRRGGMWGDKGSEIVCARWKHFKEE